MSKETITTIDSITAKIYTIRGQRIVLDYDIAKFYGVETKVLNQATRRNIERFPEAFMFQLSEEENANLRSQIVTSSLDEENMKHGGRRYSPYAFTEHGVVMLSGVLNSKQAIAVSIVVVKAFVKLRKAAEIVNETSSKIKEHDIKMLLHDIKLEDHENSINSLVSHIMKGPKHKKNEKKYGFKTDEGKNIIKEDEHVAVYC